MGFDQESLTFGHTISFEKTKSSDNRISCSLTIEAKNDPEHLLRIFTNEQSSHDNESENTFTIQETFSDGTSFTYTIATPSTGEMSPEEMIERIYKTLETRDFHALNSLFPTDELQENNKTITQAPVTHLLDLFDQMVPQRDARHIIQAIEYKDQHGETTLIEISPKEGIHIRPEEETHVGIYITTSQRSIAVSTENPENILYFSDEIASFIYNVIRSGKKLLITDIEENLNTLLELMALEITEEDKTILITTEAISTVDPVDQPKIIYTVGLDLPDHYKLYQYKLDSPANLAESIEEAERLAHISQENIDLQPPNEPSIIEMKMYDESHIFSINLQGTDKGRLTYADCIFRKDRSYVIYRKEAPLQLPPEGINPHGRPTIQFFDKRLKKYEHPFSEQLLFALLLPYQEQESNTNSEMGSVALLNPWREPDNIDRTQNYELYIFPYGYNPGAFVIKMTFEEGEISTEYFMLVDNKEKHNPSRHSQNQFEFGYLEAKPIESTVIFKQYLALMHTQGKLKITLHKFLERLEENGLNLVVPIEDIKIAIANFLEEIDRQVNFSRN